MTTKVAEKTDTFMCHACLKQKPVESEGSMYCQDCFDFMENEKKRMELPQAYWEKDNMIFVTAGEKFGITETGATVLKKAITQKGTTEPLPDPPQAVSTPQKSYDTDKADESLALDVVTDDVTAQIIELSSKGKTVRDIEKELEKEGVFMSYRTVARRLAGQRSMF